MEMRSPQHAVSEERPEARQRAESRWRDWHPLKSLDEAAPAHKDAIGSTAVQITTWRDQWFNGRGDCAMGERRCCC